MADFSAHAPPISCRDSNKVYTDNMEGYQHWEDTAHMTDIGKYRHAIGSLR